MMRLLTLILSLSLLSTRSQAQTRVVLVEELTATWCPGCPAGDVSSQQLLASHPGQVLMVAVHADAVMECMGGSYTAALDHDFLPSARVDRSGDVLYTGEWFMEVNLRLNQTPPAEVSVERTYDPATRLLTATVSAHFFTSLPAGDYRLSGIVVEDDVTGTTSGYAQQNNFSGGAQNMGGYEDLPDPVPATDMVYDHVAREILGGYDGVGGDIPTHPLAGQTYSHTFTYTIPQGYHDESIRVYGVLTKTSNHEVLNAGASLYAANDVNDAPIFLTDASTRVLIGQPLHYDIGSYDNDVEPVLIEAIAGLPSWASITMTNAHEAELSGTPTESGTFVITLQVSDGTASTTQQFVLQVDGIYDPWSPLGPGTISEDPTLGHISAVVDHATDHAYVAYPTENNKVKVRRWDGTAWSAVGSPMSAFANNQQVDVAMNLGSGKPWVAYRASETVTRVSRYTGTAWEQVGELVPGAVSQDLAFASGNMAYLVTSQENSGLRIHRWQNSTWTSVGGDSPITIPDVDQMNGPRLAFTPSTAPVVAFRAHNAVTNTYHAYLAQWNGSAWDLLGGASPCPVNELASGGPLSFHHVAIGDNGAIQVAVAHAGGINTYTVDADNWTEIGSVETQTPCTFDLLVDPDQRVILSYISCYNRVSCTAYNGTDWTSWGDDLSPQVAWQYMTSLILPDGNPALVYAEYLDGSTMTAEWLMSATVGINAPVANSMRVHAYPVPTSNLLFMDGLRHMRDDATVLDASGRPVASMKLENGRVDVSGLDPGAYILLLLQNNARVPFVRQ